MYISKVSLVNYRNFQNASFSFNKGINTIIGENGSGKTNLFRAIRLLLDDDLIKASYRLDESDFNRNLGNWKGHWIIISVEFAELSPDEAIQSLFIHGTGVAEEDIIDRATYNLFFRPKAEIRLKLSQLEEGDTDGLTEILNNISIGDYETFFAGKSSANFNDPNVYKELVGDFEKVKFAFSINATKFGARIPHQLSISQDISFTFIKALRDVVADFNSVKTNPLINLLKNKSNEIDEGDYLPISQKVQELNTAIEELPDVQEIRINIRETIKETVGETYSPSSLSIKSGLPDDAERLFQSLRLFIGEPEEDYEGGIHELSLGGANLIFLTLKLLEFKYLKSKETFANFLLIEEPEAHIHTHIQKTLFDRLDYVDTQIIYSTHSTFISEASNVQNVNILSKKRNYAEVYNPAAGLSINNIVKLQRYLDAVRSNLLFAKGVLLIEGDAEEILIPIMIKKVLGISLDELGISIINIGSTGFENVAQVFHKDRIKRYCSILTDLDTAICNTIENPEDSERLIRYKRKVAASEKSGLARRMFLDAQITGNEFLKVHYATYTFEVDFLNAGNLPEIMGIVPEVYEHSATIDLAYEELSHDDVGVFGKRILTMAKSVGKGWFAILVGGKINTNTIIPEYIINAVVFAKSNLNKETIFNIVKYRIVENIKLEPSKNLSDLIRTNEMFKVGDLDLLGLVNQFVDALPTDAACKFLQKL